MNRTRTPVEFARVLDVLDKLAVSLRGDGKGNGPLADVIDGGAAVVDGNGQQMKDALGELSNALRLSADRGTVTKDQLTVIVRNVSSLSDAAARNDEMVREFGTSVRALSQILADEDLGSGTTGKKINEVLTNTGEVLDKHRESIKALVANGDIVLNTTAVDHQRDLMEFLDVAPMTLDNLYNVADQKNGAPGEGGHRQDPVRQPVDQGGLQHDGPATTGLQHRNSAGLRTGFRVDLHAGRLAAMGGQK